MNSEGSDWKEKYLELLTNYLKDENEISLYHVSLLGREMIENGILPEEVVEEVLLPAERHLAARSPGHLLQPPFERLRGVDVHHELLLLLGDLREVEAGQLRLNRARSRDGRRRALPISRSAGGGGQVEPGSQHHACGQRRDRDRAEGQPAPGGCRHSHGCVISFALPLS